MGAGFYAMVAASILIFNIAEADKKRGWLWAGVNVCIAMLCGRYLGLSILVVVGTFLITFIVMLLSNIIFPKKLE